MRKLQPLIPWTVSVALIGYILAVGVIGMMAP
jgi:hypothetical protein